MTLPGLRAAALRSGEGFHAGNLFHEHRKRRLQQTAALKLLHLSVGNAESIELFRCARGTYFVNGTKYAKAAAHSPRGLSFYALHNRRHFNP